MSILSHWVAPLLLAAGLYIGAAALPAQAQDDLTRVLVDIADVVLRGDTPYYRHGDYGDDDRLYVQRDRYGHPVYYRNVKCNKHGKCKAEYYSSRHTVASATAMCATTVATIATGTTTGTTVAGATTMTTIDRVPLVGRQDRVFHG